ncbi:hypothetical protein ACNI3K_09455 [Demequina sp. SO4-13]|uniref:AMIN-like domain-containing (lipo)protein n=1 Tax=Demequina sp. SO4-13 TaxID=3401027 RepID=UPI003AF51109
MRQSSLTRLVALAAASALFTAGCATDDPDPTATPTATSTPTATATPLDDPSPPLAETPLAEDDPVEDEPVFGEGDQSTSGTGESTGLSPTGMRFGVHEDFDRVVIDFEGEGEPSWTAGYTDSPTAAGSGRTVEVRGDRVLEVTITGVDLPTEEDAVDWSGPASIVPQTSGVIEQATRATLFEGEQQIFIGVSSAEDFRVFALEDPTRLVVDVFHP